MMRCSTFLKAALAIPPLWIAGPYIFCKPMTIVEPIQVSEAFRKDGYSEELLQRMLVDTLSELHTVAKGVTPATADKVLSEFKLPGISVPGTGLSLSQIFEFARPLLKRDSSVYGSVIGAPADFSIVLTLRDTSGETV